MMQLFDIIASAGLWAAILRIATPLIFGTLGACSANGQVCSISASKAS